jgi:hypothetical protein
MCTFIKLKKLIAIFLLLQFLTNNSFAEEVIKLPKLFQHYQHHSHKHKDINGFADYILKHYVHEHEKDMHDGDDDHRNLPFKHSNGCCVHMHAPVLAFVPSFIEANSAFATDVVRKYTFENEKIKSICSPPIWQPPKLI